MKAHNKYAEYPELTKDGLAPLEFPSQRRSFAAQADAARLSV